MEQKDDGYIGKQVLVIFEDGQNRDGTPHISSKEGICTNTNSQEIILDNKHIIPKTRIVRAEIR